MSATQSYDVKDLALADEGVRRIEWADRQMPVLGAIRERFEKEQPLAGYRVSACLRVEPALDAGRVGGRARRSLRDPHVRDQGRGRGHLLLAHHRRRRSPAAVD